ncbi:MAG: hypothetical protein HY909_03735 [Deltaproteobacteria bacterium]|nr:hypothetical protein [Deltaproteobacteria bacterium]
MSERALNDVVLAMYGLMAGGARLLLPPTVDIPVVRTLRGAMFDRMARARGVTLTLGARRILVDIEESTTIRGNFAEGARWVIDRLIPGGRMVDAAGNLFRTFGAGLLLRRYFLEHRTVDDPVLAEIEAERIRVALRAALEVLALEHARAIAEEALLPVRQVEDARGLGIVQRWSEAAVATVAELPLAWLDAAEKVFVETLGRYRR